MFSVSLGHYRIDCRGDGLPDLLPEYVAWAKLAETFSLDSPDGAFAYLGVGRGADWPFLVVAQRYQPAGSGFFPGMLLVPETEVLFLGAGTRLLAYDLKTPARLWEDEAEAGFLRWDRFGDVVLMSAELELAAWDTRANKLWSGFVEPPWEYDVADGKVLLDVMGNRTSFDIVAGPAQPGRP